MNLAHYLTAKPFAIQRGRIHLMEDAAGETHEFEEYRQQQIAAYNQRVLNAIKQDHMSVSQIMRECGLKDSSVRRTLERLQESGLVSSIVAPYNKHLWSRA